MASRSAGSMPASRRHQRAACSGSSHVENGTGDLPCLRRLKRSSSAAATIAPVDDERGGRVVEDGVDAEHSHVRLCCPGSRLPNVPSVDRPRRTDPPGFGAAPHGQDARMFDDQQVIAAGRMNGTARTTTASPLRRQRQRCAS